jgi:hypothetical protein
MQVRRTDEIARKSTRPGEDLPPVSEGRRGFVLEEPMSFVGGSEA